MFKKLGRALGGGSFSAKGNLKVKFELQVVQAERLPQSVRKCRIVWSRCAKLVMTATKDVKNGTAVFKQTLVQVGSVHKDKHGEYEPKEYVIKVQMPDGSSGDNMITIGKATINLAQYVMDTTNTQNEMLPITYKVGTSTSGYVKLVIATTVLGDIGEDGMTEVSGITGLTSEGTTPDQDLEGFDDSPANRKRSAKGAPQAAKSNASKSQPSKAALPSTREEEDSEDERAPAKSKGKSSSAMETFGKKSSTASKPLAAKSKWQDEDISPVESELSEGEDARPPPKKTEAAAKSKGWSEPQRPAEPEMDFNDMKSALFSKKKPEAASSSSGGGKAGTSGSSNSRAVPPALDEDAARSALFSVPSKAGRAAAKAAPVVLEDEDMQRDALFATGKKAAGVATGKISSGKSKSASQPVDADDEEANRGALFSAPAKGSKGNKSPTKTSKAPVNDFDDFDDEPAFPAPTKASSKPTTSTSRAPPPAPAPANRRTPEPQYDSEEDELGVVSSSKRVAAAAVVGNSRREANGPSSDQVVIENEKLQQEVQQLQRDLKVANQHIRELEDKLAEVDDVAGLYTQMREMEAAHKAELDKLKRQYEEHLNEMEEQLHEAQQSSGPTGRALAEREQELVDRETEAQAKVDEANRMVNESMVVAVKHQQEKKALQEEIDRLRAALPAGKGRQGLGAAYDDDEDDDDYEAMIQELKDQVAELQKKNDQLSKASMAVTQEASTLLEEVTTKMRGLGLSMPRDKGADPVSILLPAFNTLFSELKEVEDQLREASASPHPDLERRVQTLTTDNQRMQELLDALQLERDQLSQRVANLSAGGGVRAAVAGTTATAGAAMALSARTRSVARGTRGPDTDDLGPSTPVAAEVVGAAPGTWGAAVVPVEVARLEAEKAALEQQIQDLRYELRQAKNAENSNIMGLQAELHALQQVQQKAALDLKRAQDEVSALEAENLRLEAANERFEAAAAASATSISRSGSGADGDVGLLRAQVAALQQEKTELEARLAEFAEAEQIIKDWSEYADTLTAERDGLISERDKVVAEREKAVAEREKAVAERYELEQQVQALTGERDKLQLQLEEAKGQLLSVEQELVGVQQQLEAVQVAQAQRGGEVRQMLAALQVSHQQLQTQHGAVQQQLEAVQAAHTQLQEEHQALQQEHDTCQMLQEQHSTVQQQLDAVQEECKQLQAQNDELQQELVQLHSECQPMQQELAVVQAECTRIKAQHTALQKELSQLQAQHQAAVRDAATLRLENDQYQRGLEHMQQSQYSSSEATTLVLSKAVAGTAAIAASAASASSSRSIPGDVVGSGSAQQAGLHAEVQALKIENEQLRVQLGGLHEVREQLQQLTVEAMSHPAAASSAARSSSDGGEPPAPDGKGWDVRLERLQTENASLRVQLQGMRDALASARAAAAAATADLGVESEDRPSNTSRESTRIVLAERPWGLPRPRIAGRAGAPVPPASISTDGSDVGSQASMDGSSSRRESAIGQQGTVVAASMSGTVQMALQLSELQERHAVVVAELEALRSTVGTVPLLGAAAQGPTTATQARGRAGESNAVQLTSGLSVSQLTDKVSVLTAWRTQAEATLATIQADHSNLKLDHSEALAHAAELQQRLASREDALQQFQAQVAQLSNEPKQAREAGTASGSSLVTPDTTGPQTSSPLHTTPSITRGRGIPLPSVRLDPQGDEEGNFGDEDAPPMHSRGDKWGGAREGDAMLSPRSPTLTSPATSPKALYAGGTGGNMATFLQRDNSVPLDTEAGRLTMQLRTAAAVVHITRCALASCYKVLSSTEVPPVSDDVELDVALMSMKDESYGLFQELKRQAREAPRYEAQVTALSQTLVELEAQVHELQQENQLLAGFNPHQGHHPNPHPLVNPVQLFGPGAMAAANSGGSRYLGQSTGVSTPELGPASIRTEQGSPDHVGTRGGLLRHSGYFTTGLVSTNPLYADDTGLVLSAMEAQLALAESQRQEAQEGVEEVGRENVRLRREVERLTGELASGPGIIAQATLAAAVSTTSMASGRARSVRRPTRLSSDEEEQEDMPRARSALAARRTASKSAIPQEVTKELETLRERCAKLEGICEDLEQRAEEERKQYELQLNQAMADVRKAQEEAAATAAAAAAAGAAAKGRRTVDDDLGAGGDDLKALREQVAELEVQSARLSRENLSLAEQLEDERHTRETLERQVKRGLKNMNEDEVLETVEAFESKYTRLKDKYKKLEMSTGDELDDMHAQLMETQQQLEELKRNGGGSAGTRGLVAGVGGVSVKEVAELRKENEHLVSQLVYKQLEAAELAEQQAMLKRELYRAKEVNMKLAAKMTRLEAQAYTGSKIDTNTHTTPATSPPPPQKTAGWSFRKRRETHDDEE